VKRQLEDCRKLAASLGWVVGEEYVDNDLSAYSGKPRPEYQRMLLDLADGARDAVIVYHVDRLTRRPIELEQFLDVLTAANVRHVRFVAAGDLDIGNGDGLMVLRMLLAVAANESATKSRRVKRKMEQNAAAGLPHGGYRRPFGYAEDKITIVPAEAEVIRTLAERLVAGESLALAGVLARGRGDHHGRRRPVANADAAGAADLRPDRRAARAPRLGGRTGGVGADRHRADPRPDPGSAVGAESDRPAQPPAVSAVRDAALRQVPGGAVQRRPAGHPPLRLLGRAGPRRLRTTDGRGRAGGGPDHPGGAAAAGQPGVGRRTVRPGRSR
jgi:DNA invertase Pin-like site-specific DNA recombinase